MLFCTLGIEPEGLEPRIAWNGKDIAPRLAIHSKCDGKVQAGIPAVEVVKKIRERSSRSGVMFRRCRGICSPSRNSHPTQMFFGKEKLRAGLGIDEIHQKSVSQMEDGGLSERQESIVPIPNWYLDMMNIKQRTLNGTCLGQTFLRSLREGRDLMGTAKKEVLRSSPRLGRVLIVTRDHVIRDFLGQILKLHGYDCEYLEKLPKAMMEQTWKDFDALFIESHSLERLKRGMSAEISHASDSPMVVVLGDLPPLDETGHFRELKKPLDYRQMGRLMDECLFLKTQRCASQGD